jgi:inner membrane protein
MRWRRPRRRKPRRARGVRFRQRPADAPPGRERGACVETFGVAFIDPVSGYTLSDRATKYGLLFIALTFLGVAAIEVLRQVRVHPIQYLLVGSGIAMFFLLLVSLSEHLPFAAAYLAASAACTVLLGFYGRFVLGGPARASPSAPRSAGCMQCSTCCSSWSSGPCCSARSCSSQCSPR